MNKCRWFFRGHFWRFFSFGTQSVGLRDLPSRVSFKPSAFHVWRRSLSWALLVIRLPHFCNYILKQIWSRSFIWGTKHWFWSRGCKDIRGQSWRSKKISARAPDSRPMHPGPAVSADIFFDLQLWPLISLQPLDQNQCLVPHMKDLLRICLEIKGQSFWMNFKVCNYGSK